MLRGAVVSLLLVAPALASASTGPEPWWLATTLDLDGDRVDDALAALPPDAPVVLLLAYDGVPTLAQRRAVDAAGLPVLAAYEHFDVLAVRAPPRAAPALLALPGVVFVEPADAIERLLRESVPLIGAPTVWADDGATGAGVVVAILDDGAFEQHPDLADRVAGRFDASIPVGGIAASASVAIVPAGHEGHATHVAGVIVGPGTRSGGELRGVAPGARFVDVKVFEGPNRTSSEIVLRGLDWTLANADRLGIRVAQMSIGGRPTDGRDALSRAVDVAVDEGLVVIAASGNGGPDAGTVSTPGAAEKAITVGAVDKQKRLAAYSGRGPVSDGRLKPDLVAPGSAIRSTVPPVSTTSVLGLVAGGTDVFYGSLSGTSMAAPHVAGVVALMLEAEPTLTPAQVRRILLATAQDVGEPGPDDATGYGFVNAIAAVQVARDPALLDSPQFAEVLATLPGPRDEDALTRAQVALDDAARSGLLLLVVVGVALLIGAGVAVALLRRRAP